MPDESGPASETALPDTTAPTVPTASTAEVYPPVSGEGGSTAGEPAVVAAAPVVEQSSLAAPPAAPRGLSYAVDIVFCIDVTGSMTPILDAVKANALRFYDDVQHNLTAKGKNVDELRVRVVAFRDFVADGELALQESPFFRLPAEQAGFSDFVNGLIAQGGGDAPESGLEAVALAVNSPWTNRGDRRRQVVVVWTDQPAHPLDPTTLPAELRGRVPADFSALTDLWEDAQGPLGRQQQAADPLRPRRSRLERHLRRLGERRTPPVAGRRRAVGGGLRDDRGLHR